MFNFTINSVDDLLRHVPRSDDLDHRVVFRGQGEDLPLVPSLFRDGHGCVGHGANWRSYEQKIMRFFQREAVPSLKREPKSITDWIALAQHHGLPTRMLDWLLSPLTALYFAVEGMETSRDGVIWSYVSCHLRFTPFEHWSNLHDITETWLFTPHHEDHRMTAQSGCLTIHPLPKNDDPFTPFGPDSAPDDNWSKFIIPGASKPGIMFQLGDLGINAHSVFPDLDGLAKEIKQRIFRLHNLCKNANPLRVSQRLM